MNLTKPYGLRIWAHTGDRPHDKRFATRQERDRFYRQFLKRNLFGALSITRFKDSRRWS